MDTKKLFYKYKKSLYCFTDNLNLCKKLLDAGIKIIQYRDKNADDITYFSIAEQMLNLMGEYKGALLIINDRVDIAIKLGADGIHIGQEDEHYKKVIRRVPDNMIIGVSVKTIEDAGKVEKAGATYLGVGAAFPTFTKDNAMVIGLEKLSQIVQSVKIPVVAIGGITLKNISSVQKTGADNFAVISDINNSENISNRIKQYNYILEKRKK